MKAPALHIAEAERLLELINCNILDTPPEIEFDQITKLASQICNTPISLISFVDSNRQWFKSTHGIEVEELERNSSFCGHAIVSEAPYLIVENTHKDLRFSDNPLVLGPPNVVFYAGIVLKGEDSLPLGTLCVVDTRERELDDSQLDSLMILGKQVERLIELRKAKVKMELYSNELQEKNQELEKFAGVAAHDIKSPLNKILGLTHLLTDYHRQDIGEDAVNMVFLLKQCSLELRDLVNGILAHSRSSEVLATEQEHIVASELFYEVINLFEAKPDVKFTIESNLAEIKTNRVALLQILINLITNGIKYGDKDQTIIQLEAKEITGALEFTVADNGPGIPIEFQKEIFHPFFKINRLDRYGEKGNGLGLATVKRLVEHQGGKVYFTSEPNKGTEFKFTLPRPLEY